MNIQPRMRFVTSLCAFITIVVACAGAAVDATWLGMKHEMISSWPPRYLVRWLSSMEEDGCELTEECRLCDAEERSKVSECAETGRVEIWRCHASRDTEEGDEETTPEHAGIRMNPMYHRCSRTRTDDEFLMVRHARKKVASICLP